MSSPDTTRTHAGPATEQIRERPESTADSAAERQQAAERALLEMGIRARVLTRGAGEIAVIQASLADRPRLTGPDAPAIAARVRAAGFRYVSIELDSSDAPADRRPRSTVRPGGDLPQDELETTSG